MSREAHVRFCEGLGVQFPRPTHPYIPTPEDWLYLAVVLSIQTRQVLGYSRSDRMPDDLVEQPSLKACQRSPGRQRVLFHRPW